MAWRNFVQYVVRYEHRLSLGAGTFPLYTRFRVGLDGSVPMNMRAFQARIKLKVYTPGWLDVHVRLLFFSLTGVSIIVRRKISLLAVEHPIDPVYDVPRVALRVVN